MRLEDLILLAPPPVEPVDAPRLDAWEEVERALDFTFPNDYKGYVQRYGTGMIGGWIYPLHPFATSPAASLRDRWASMLELIDYFHREVGGPGFPYPAYPKPDGLFPWATDDYNNLLCWHQSGPPNDWTVVVAEEVDRETYHAYDMGMVEFLVRWLRRDLRCPAFPDDVPPSADQLFYPSSQ